MCGDFIVRCKRTIAPGSLCGVKSGIRLRDNCIEVAGKPLNSTSGGHSYSKRFPSRRNFQSTHCIDQFLCDQRSLFRAFPSQHDCEFFSANPSKRSGIRANRAQPLAKSARDRLENSIPRRVPMSVVEHLEFIYIKHHNRHGRAIRPAVENRPSGLVKMTPIGNTGQAVGVREVFKVSLGTNEQVRFSDQRKNEKRRQ